MRRSVRGNTHAPAREAGEGLRKLARARVCLLSLVLMCSIVVVSVPSLFSSGSRVSSVSLPLARSLGVPVCKQHKLFFIETSALADSNVGTAFETILKEIYRLISRKTVGADGQAVSPPAEFKGDTIALTAENQNPQPQAAKGKCCS